MSLLSLYLYYPKIVIGEYGDLYLFSFVHLWST